MPVVTIEGSHTPHAQARFAIVAARWNEFIVDRLLDGALDTLRDKGVTEDRIHVARVPGAYEIPLACKLLAETKRYAAVITLGCVIRGATTHYEIVSEESASGVTRVGLDTGVPVIFGVLTTENLEQAMERAGDKGGNKGAEAALVAIEMANLVQLIRAPQAG